MLNPRVSRIILSEWFGCSLGVLMVACVALAVHEDRPPTGFERAVSYGSLIIVGGWLLIKGWSMRRTRGVKRR
jgi:hypothetical protein